jgi:predicted DNA-binding protein with PD1-like motif
LVDSSLLEGHGFLPKGTPFMKGTLLREHAGERTFVLIFDLGDEVMRGLTEFAEREKLRGSRMTAIGALSDAVVGFLDWENEGYKHTVIREQMEVLSLVGDVAVQDGKPKIHAHIVLGKADATGHGGHFIEGHVRPTLKIVIVESAKHLQRELDERTGLALIRLP